jgi:hypothetical protein
VVDVPQRTRLTRRAAAQRTFVRLLSSPWTFVERSLNRAIATADQQAAVQLWLALCGQATLAGPSAAVGSPRPPHLTSLRHGDARGRHRQAEPASGHEAGIRWFLKWQLPKGRRGDLRALRPAAIHLHRLGSARSQEWNEPRCSAFGGQRSKAVWERREASCAARVPPA